MTETVALVTGGTRGIGREIAMRLLADGWQVAICARSEPVSIPAAGDRKARFYQADLRDPGECERLAAKVVTDFSRLDLLVNNAGGSPAATMEDSSHSLINKIIALNLEAPLFLAKSCLAALQESSGSIVNIASISGQRAAPGTVAYGAAKAGLINATKGLAMELAPKVRVNAIVLGLVHNPEQIEHYGGDELISQIESVVPMRRLATGDDVAATIAWLVSDQAAYITGSAIEVHGGGEVPSFLSVLPRSQT